MIIISGGFGMEGFYSEYCICQQCLGLCVYALLLWSENIKSKQEAMNNLRSSKDSGQGSGKETGVKAVDVNTEFTECTPWNVSLEGWEGGHPINCMLAPCHKVKSHFISVPTWLVISHSDSSYSDPTLSGHSTPVWQSPFSFPPTYQRPVCQCHL
jgi:hypothetical protein